MITEDQLEQLAIQWFQDTGWSYVNGTVISPEGEAPEREDFRAVVLKGRLAEAVGVFGSRQISRQSVAGRVLEDRDMNRDMVSRFGVDSGGEFGIATEIPTTRRDFALLAEVKAQSRQWSRHHGWFGHKKAHQMGRPFRAWDSVGDGTQDAALGYRMMPRWGVGRRVA